MVSLRCSPECLRLLMTLGAPIILSPFLFMDFESSGLRPEAARCAFVVLLMSVYWLLELLPLAVTALIPVVLFPALGVLSTGQTTVCYFKEVNMLMVGGLIVAIAIEEVGLHRRIALKIMLTLGTGPRRLLLGFMLTTMFLSMWLSSIAVTVMMIPIAQVVLEETAVEQLEHDSEHGSKGPMVSQQQQQQQQHLAEQVTINLEEPDNLDKGARRQWESPENERRQRGFRKMLLLSVAYSANIGGTGTMTGSTPNLGLIGMLESQGNADRSNSINSSGLNFTTWFFFAAPGMLINNLLAYVWLQVVFFTKCPSSSSDGSGVEESGGENDSRVKKLLLNKYQALGSLSKREFAVLLCFVTMILLWFSRNPRFMPGWGQLLTWHDPDTGNPIAIGNASSVILVSIIIFVVRVDGKPLLDWNAVQRRLPWGLILLLGGGFAMASASEKSSLSTWIGTRLALMGGFLEPWVIALIISLLVSFMTEITSNTATANVILPILLRLASSLSLPPIYFALPAAICCSYAFMLPVATPPNAMVFEAINQSGKTEADKMKTKEMFVTGFVMNLICVSVSIVSMNFWSPIILDMGMTEIHPDSRSNHTFARSDVVVN